MAAMDLERKVSIRKSLDQRTAEETAIGDIDVVLDPIKEKKLLMKLDMAFVPIIMLTYLSCFLDRSNIGNVKVAGMPQDIGASDSEYSTAVSIFYATYVLLEAPWAVAMKRLTPRNILTGLCIIWSITTVFTGFIHNVASLYATRLILGGCEAGLFPCLNLYLTMVYRREEQAKRVSYLMSCAAISGAVGGLLAYGLLQMDGIGGKAGWRWVYIIEGLFSLICAILIWFGLPNDPSNAYFLTDDEKGMMRIRNDQRRKYMGSEQFSWEEMHIALRDPKLLFSAVTQFCQDILLYGFSTFLPTILESLGYDSLMSNVLTVPVYIWAAAVFIAVAVWADRVGRFSIFILITNIFGILGYILLLSVPSNPIKYFATYLCGIAVYTGVGLNVAWLNVNVAPQYRRALAIGLQQTIGNCAGIVAGQVYRTSPYVLGNGFSLGALVVAQVVVASHAVYLRRENVVKEGVLAGGVDTRRVRTGDGEVEFRYHI
ncbi:permease of the major facilitator superfamily [Aspergillus ibericus CBS 121593]|uniref:Permease of the major facilitator superfamily n=1 Tax=Aspergillus ibericus CBS 121593 TaxID=1448316 RepID=A0A395GIV6_9EURO|nr:permease of the major facilitator superfamily [Aspergillus ibericus CBS 121593]RAK95294.1 permease of the major facilitator superfamily [Aspergillus ibericus CBS 121593]